MDPVILVNDRKSLEAACWEISRQLDPSVDVSQLQNRIGLWRQEFRQRCRWALTRRGKVARLTRFMFEELRFSGAGDETYNTPGGSLPAQVMRFRQGTPVVLGTIFSMIAEGAGMQIDGINLPGHFVMRHKGMYIDVFHRGRIMSKADCREILTRQNLKLRDSHLQPAAPSAIFLRILTNLAYAYGLENNAAKLEVLYSWGLPRPAPEPQGSPAEAPDSPKNFPVHPPKSRYEESVNVEVLNTGTELLLGNVINSHLAWFGQRLFPIGLRIARQTTIPDGAAIRQGLLEAFGRCDVLIVTGGLGPTTDDITREVAAELIGAPLREDAGVVAAIAARLERRGITFRERMRRQAMVPVGATVLPNDNGTAPGLYIPATQTSALATPHLFFLPGPPRELKPMFDDYALPILRELCGGVPDRECRTYHVVGMGESGVEELVGLNLVARGDIEVGYCARPNEVDFRLIAPKPILDEVEPGILAALGSHIVSQKGEALEEVVVARLRELGRSVAMAESCTGGFLAHRITNVPGASEIFFAGYVTYANEAKTRSVGVPAELIAEHGAVSEPVARAMAEGAAERSGSDFGIGITGIAGPGGGTDEKPVGTVFIALAERGGKTICERELFPTDRETFKQLATQAALDMLRLRIF